MKLQKARRKQVKLRLGLSGPSGFGKTYSALLLAYGMTQNWSTISVVDTENDSASLYAELGEYNTLNLEAPYSPERVILALKTCEKANMSVVIIDSLSKEWNGKGGCLELHEQLGGRFQDWQPISRRHQALLDAILSSKCHVIVTVRKKIDYSMEKDSNGRTKVVKLGLKDITKEGLDFEMTTFFEIINDKNLVIASKDRTNLFSGKPEFVINASTGRKLMQWCNQEFSVDQARKEIEVCTTIEGLRHLYQKYIRLKELTHPIIINRKAELEAINSQVVSNKEIINPLKTKEHGANN